MDQKEFEQYCLLNNDSIICIHEPTLQFVEISDSCEKILGYTRQELIGKNPYDFYHPADLDIVQKDGHLPALDGKYDSAIIYRFRKKSGDYIWLRTKFSPFENENGAITSLVSISEDYTNFFKLNSEHTVSEELYTNSLASAKIGVWEVDLQTNHVSWSNTAYDIFETDINGINNFPNAGTFITEAYKNSFSQAIDKAYTKGIPFDITPVVVTGKGKNKWVRIVGRPGLKYGKTVKLYGIFQDVNNEIEQQLNLKSVNEKLTTQKKQLEDFNQIVSHNLRSPVTNLNILLNLLKTSDSEEERYLFIEKLSGVANKLTVFLDDIVDVVKVISNRDIQSVPLKIDEIVYDAAKMLEGNIKQLDAFIQIQTEQWNEINYPKLYLDSIILNLLSNALKYSSPDRKPYITITTKFEGEEKILEIADNGLGIDIKKYGDKVFKLHKTFHREKPGKGLGLFMTRNQIESMGGEIAVTSEVNVGTTFKINFKKNK